MDSVSVFKYSVFLGNVTTLSVGALVSSTITVAVQVTISPLSVFPVKVTMVSPGGNMSGASLVINLIGSSSFTEIAFKVALAPFSLVCSTVTSCGQTRGEVLRVTLIESVSLRPNESVSVIVILLVPSLIPKLRSYV